MQVTHKFVSAKANSSDLTLVQPSNWNDIHQITGFSIKFSDDYNFTPQVPGGNLTGGVGATITLTPVPPGVNGSDLNHYLYISNGVGTPEAVKITGGTAVGGNTTGTIIITPVNSHSGAWTIQSATAGIQEAIADLNPTYGGKVTVPVGSFPIYSAINIVNVNNIVIEGQGNASALVPQFSSGDVFLLSGPGVGGVTGYYNDIKNLAIGPSAQTVTTPNTLTAIHVTGQNNCLIERNVIHDVKYGVQIDGSSSIVHILKNSIGGLNPTSGVGVLVNGCSDIYIIENFIAGYIANQPRAGVEYAKLLAGSKLAFNDIFATGSGLILDPATGDYVTALESTSNWLDSCTTDGVSIIPNAGSFLEQIRFNQDWMCTNGVYGIRFGGGAAAALDGISFNQLLIQANGQEGIYFANSSAKNIEFIGCQVAGNSASSSGTYHGFLAFAGCGGFKIIGGTFAQSNGQPNSQNYGIYVAAGAADNYLISDTTVVSNAHGTISDGGSGSHNRVVNNPGYNPVGQSIISVGGSPFTYTAGHSPETIYLVNGAVSNIKVGATTVAGASPAQLALGPNQAITVTYTIAPTMVKDVQ